MKVKEAIKVVEEDGWEMVRMKGSHRQYRHPRNRGSRYDSRKNER